MLAFSLLRYWCLKPLMPDPLNIKNHDPLKSRSITSFMEPCIGPQEKPQHWAFIPDYIGGANTWQRSLIEIEKAMHEGKDMILIEPEAGGQSYYHYLSYGWLLQENTMFYGSLGLFFSYYCPKHWCIYVPCTFFALMHSWVYFRAYKYDRLSEYQGYDDDRHPVSNLFTAWVLGQRPDHFKCVLKKEKSIMWEIISETILYSSIISTLVSLGQIEEYVVGGKFTPSFQHPTVLNEALYAPAYYSGYFQPAEMVPVAPGIYLPSDIPKVTGWFDLPRWNFRLKPMKYDLALIICLSGGYFLYKAFEHFFGYSEADGDEADELGREWNRDEMARTVAENNDVSKYWVQPDNSIDYSDIILTQSLNYSPENEATEQAEMARIASQEPYGLVKSGYRENHYGIYL